MFQRMILTCMLLVPVVAWGANPTPSPEQLENWHQWRGPLGNGMAPEASPPLEWSETKNVRWKVAVPGKGSATPVIWGDKIFVLTAIPTDREGPPQPKQPGPPAGRRGLSLDRPTNIYQFCVLCYDRKSGEELWRQVAREEVPHEGGHPTNTFASGSPITDGQFLYASFGSYGTYCYDLDGNLKWSRDLGDMQTRASFGEGSSPALHDGTLVLLWDHEGPSAIFALDAATGETRWEKPRDEPTTWNTPYITEHAGGRQVITNGTNRTRSYDLATGELLWECGGQATNPIPSPVVLNETAFVMTGYRGYAVYAIPLSARGDLTDSDKIVWRRTDAGPYISSPLLFDETLYFTKSRDAILYSVEALTGSAKIDGQRIPQLGTLYASPVGAAGRIYFCDRNGTTTVLKHGDEVEVLAVNKLPEVLDASPALVGRQMFLRGDTHLYCIEE